jgi:hypothetical protein
MPDSLDPEPDRPGVRGDGFEENLVTCATLSPHAGHEERDELLHLRAQVPADLLRLQAAGLDPVGATMTG